MTKFSLLKNYWEITGSKESLWWDCREDISHRCCHLKISLGPEDPLPRWPTPVVWAGASVSQWLMGGLLGSAPEGSLHTGAWVSSQHVNWLPKEWTIPGRRPGETTRPSVIISGVTHDQSHHILFVKSESPTLPQGERN